MCRQDLESPVAHQPGDHVGRLRRQSPEVPLHVGAAQVAAGQALLGTDEVLELQGVSYEENRGVVAHDVEIALGRVELDGEASRVAPGVGRAPLPGHGGETNDEIRAGPGLEDRGLGIGADILVHRERPERTPAFGVGLALGDALPVEVGHLLDEVEILEEDWAIRSDRQGVLLAGDGNTGICRGRRPAPGGLVHACSFRWRPRPRRPRRFRQQLFFPARVDVFRISPPSCCRSSVGSGLSGPMARHKWTSVQPGAASMSKSRPGARLRGPEVPCVGPG